jgi:outer membrane protein TolC
MTKRAGDARSRLMISFLLTLILSVAGAGGSEAGEVQPQARTAPSPPSAAPMPTLSLADCLQLSFQKQPALAAQRASLAAAEANARALDNLRLPRFLAPDLPVRRQQAALGVTAAAGGLEHAEHETIYAVTRHYFTVIYAREQERVARGIVERLTALFQTAQQQLNAGARNVTQTDVDRTSVYLDLAETRRLQAEEGAERGLAALREAMGLEPGCPLDVLTGGLPEPSVRPRREEIIAGALAHRAAIVQAGTFAEVAGLEVEAQSASRRRRMDTFASATDIHARLVPPGSRDTEYSPEGVPPEMPVQFVGSRPERVQRATAMNERAGAVAEKTRALVALDAEEAFRRWEEASRKLVPARRAATTGDRLAASLRTDYTTSQKVRLEDVLNAEVLASQARSQYNEFLFQQILALADLERVTGGAFCAQLTTPAPSPAPPPSSSGKQGADTGAQPLFPSQSNPN